jgi:hypothetical protein
MNIYIGNGPWTATEQNLNGRTLTVNEARPRTDRPRTGASGGAERGKFINNRDHRVRESALLGLMREGFSHNSGPRHRFLTILILPHGRRHDSIVIRSGDLSPEQ